MYEYHFIYKSDEYGYLEMGRTDDGVMLRRMVDYFSNPKNLKDPEKMFVVEWETMKKLPLLELKKLLEDKKDE